MATTKPKPDINAILRTFLALGSVAVSLFVKNPEHHEHAAQIVGAMNDVLPMLTNQQPQ